MVNEFIQKHEADFVGAIEHYKKELAGLRAGRANSAMVENLLVDCYGVKTPLKQVGSIAIPEPRCLTIEPWDKSLLKEIEKAIAFANLGLSISAEAALVRVTVPQMTEESRKDLIKIMSEKLEVAKVSVRGIREKVKEEIIEALKNSDITEDDRYQYADELDKKVAELNKNLQNITEEKEKEIMTV
jgi:ribosome recycling factor